MATICEILVVNIAISNTSAIMSYLTRFKMLICFEEYISQQYILTHRLLNHKLQN